MDSGHVTVYGAYGHTGRFVVAELLRRGISPVLAGRDAARLARFAADHPGLAHRAAPVDEPAMLRRVLKGSSVVINCAGPFLDTAVPVALASVAVGAHYLDVSAEQAAVQETYRMLDVVATAAGVAVVPALAFYGGLADLLVTAAAAEVQPTEVKIAIGLDRWWPTEGTRRTGARNTVPRVTVRDGQVVLLEDSEATTWRFPKPFGEQPVVPVPFSEVVTIARHLAVNRLDSYLNTTALDDVRDDETPPPTAVDESGKSAQRFVVDVEVGPHPVTTRISASGRDIYAVTAPILVAGAMQLLAGRARKYGAVAPGEVFDVGEMLLQLADDVVIERSAVAD